MSEYFDAIRSRARRYADAMWGPAWDANISATEASMRLGQAGRAMNEADDEQAQLRAEVESLRRQIEEAELGEHL